MGKLTGWLPRDPRTCQTAALSLFLLYGVTRLRLPLSAGDVTLTITTALVTQFFFSRAVSSDASPTRPLCAVKRASMPAARAAAVNLL